MFGADMNYHPPKCSITWNVEASLIKSAIQLFYNWKVETFWTLSWRWERFASLSRSIHSATGTKTQQQKSLYSQKVGI